MPLEIKSPLKNKKVAEKKTKERIRNEPGTLNTTKELPANRTDPYEHFRNLALVNKEEENRLMLNININLASENIAVDPILEETYIEALEQNLIFLSENSDAFYRKALKKGSVKGMKSSEVRVL